MAPAPATPPAPQTPPAALLSTPAAPASPLVVVNQHDGKPVPAEFIAFWLEFRRAVLASDWKAVESMTRFPVMVKGVSDEDPVQKVDKAKLPKLLQDVLGQQSGTSQRQETMREQLQRLEMPDRRPMVTDTWARVEDFEFERKDNAPWRFFSTYL